MVLLAILFGFSFQWLAAQEIKPYEANRFYWEYRGEPVLLLGGSIEDNLFQIPDLREHLDLLKSAGGNYVRCTMSSRDEGNVWAFQQDPSTGLYDLNQPNPAYWRRFETFLEETARRHIIVQIEVWATFDFYDGNEMNRPYWQSNPFNPKNNINYTAETSGLEDEMPCHPTGTCNPFFRTPPEADDNPTVRKFQKLFVDWLLERSLKYGHVLYCMDNETSVDARWGAYWAHYIRSRAGKREVQLTEMWDPWDLAHPMHRATFDHPELYSFVDVSQNNHQKSETHWSNGQLQRQRIQNSGTIRPINNVKVYGADSGRFGSDRDGIERFWRNIFGGFASTRFHRPDSGIGLNSKAQTHIRSLRMLTDRFGVFDAFPDNELLSEREENEAFCIARPGEKYAVFFPDGGDVQLRLNGEERVKVEWLDASSSRWHRSEEISTGQILPLKAPSSGYWAVLVNRISSH